MRPLTLYVLEHALRQTRAWLDDGIELTMAVNLSVPNLLDLRLPEDVGRLLEETKVPPSMLQLEVTENIIMADPVRVIEVLQNLKKLGIRLSLDDFGTGSSSLSYLKHLPLDELKIDRSFVLAMTESEPDAVIVRSTTELARRLGLSVVAEGVETHEAWEQLADIGCEQAQGFYLQRPLGVDEFNTWLREWAASHGAPIEQPRGQATHAHERRTRPISGRHRASTRMSAT
jgi:EAL domain-containing protein (putative c-di-GMP-specific phosphodiesterase class I)